MRIDAHQHVWQVARGDYGWLTPDLDRLYRDFMPADLAPLLAASGVDGTILVQAAPTLAETTFLLDVARATPFVLGVVGWVDFEAPDAPDIIAGLAADPLMVGLRPMIQDIADDDWMLRPDLRPAFEAMIAHDLTFDALVLPRHLPRLRTLMDMYPALRVVVDHAAKPQIADGLFEPWAAGIASIASQTGAFCKLSGLVSEAGASWQPSDLAPYIDHLLAVFGPERLIWGSDWPVATLAVDYGAWAAQAQGHLPDADDLAAVFGGTAPRAYRLTPR